MEAKRVNLWRRLAAAAYDTFLLIALYFVVGWVAVLANDGEAEEGFWLFWVLLALAWGFFIKFWCHPGQTLGMQVWKVRVVQLDGSPLTLRLATARYVFALVSWGCLGLGFLWSLFDKEGRTWHDRLSQTKLEFIDHRKTAS